MTKSVRRGLGIMLIAIFSVIAMGLEVAAPEWIGCGIVALIGFVKLVGD